MEYSLVDFLAWLATGAGSGAVAYWLWGVLERASPKVDELSKEIKSYLTLGLAVLAAVVGYVGQLAMNYKPVPTTATEWIESLFSVVVIALPSVIASRAIHARLQLKGK